MEPLLGKKLGYVVGAVTDILLPRTCAVCGARLDTDEAYLCRECMSDIPFTYNWDRKYHAIADRLNLIIQQDLHEYEPYSFVSSLFFYNEDNGYRHICHKLKYQGDIRIGRYFSRELGKRLNDSPLFRDIDLVIPVPLHWTRKWDRGYNQAAIIGREIAGVLNAGYMPDFLVRKKKTASQTTLDLEQKKANVSDAFSVSEKARKIFVSETGPKTWPGHVLITDDVFTSGATTAACRRVLRTVFPPEVRISVATLAAVEEE